MQCSLWSNIGPNYLRTHMINKIKDIILPNAEKTILMTKIALMNPSLAGPTEPDLRVVGLFCDVNEEKIAEIIHSVIFFNEMNLQ